MFHLVIVVVVVVVAAASTGRSGGNNGAGGKLGGGSILRPRLRRRRTRGDIARAAATCHWSILRFILRSGGECDDVPRLLLPPFRRPRFGSTAARYAIVDVAV